MSVVKAEEALAATWSLEGIVIWEEEGGGYKEPHQKKTWALCIFATNDQKDTSKIVMNSYLWRTCIQPSGIHVETEAPRRAPPLPL